MSKAAQKLPATVDDDVEDLDDILEQFTPAPSKQPQKPKATSSASSPPPKSDTPSAQKRNTDLPEATLGLENLNLTDDFTRELAEGMASLMREIAAESDVAGGNGDGDGPQTGDDKEREMAFRKAWEDMLVEGMNGVLDPSELGGEPLGAPKGKEKGETGGASKVPDDAFQSSIRAAMNKLKESESNLQAESASGAANPFDEILAQLGEGTGGGETEEELQGILESMMTQLMSKEILYEPLKELHEKFPSYLTENESKLKPEDKQRYVSQQVIVTKIVSVFDSPTYSDDNLEQGATIVTLMNEMQSHGSPPPEIMGPLPPGMNVGPDGMPKLPDGCTIA